jgi:hypothetical protein
MFAQIGDSSPASRIRTSRGVIFGALVGELRRRARDGATLADVRRSLSWPALCLAPRREYRGLGVAWRSTMSGGMHSWRARTLFLEALFAVLASPCAAQPGTPVQGHRDSYGAATYTVPPGWGRITNPSNPGAATYQSPVYDGGEVCRIAVFPPVPSSGDIVNDARKTTAGLMGVDPLANSGPPFPYTTIIRGLSPQGWAYFIIKHSINGRFGEYGRLYGTTTLAVQLGNQTVVIVGTGKDPQVSQCFGELVRDAWPAFFASLQFNTQPTAQQEQAFRSGIVGSWTAVASGMAAGQYTFTAQGRYLSTAAFRQRTPAGANLVLETTSAYFGDGRFSFQGNTLVLTPDSGRGGPTRAVIRIEQESKDNGAQLGTRWTDRLCLMEGGGEVCYSRSR